MNSWRQKWAARVFLVELLGIDRIDERAIFPHDLGGDEFRPSLNRRIVPMGRTGTDQKLMIEKRPSEGGVEHVIRQCVFFRQRPHKGIGVFVVTHGEASGALFASIAVHFAAVDLLLFLIKPVNQITGKVPA